MKFTETILKGAYIIEPELLEDERGFFTRIFDYSEFEDHGLKTRIVQSNISYNNKKGILRGMHYQVDPYKEAKLVSCIKGAACDIFIDLRVNSETYQQWYMVELTEENYRMIYIPEDFAHGFQTLEDDTILSYHMFNYYKPECARIIGWNDPAYGIRWPIQNPILSEKDRNYRDHTDNE